MPEIRDNEISLATCDAAGWTVSVGCDLCRALFPLQLDKLRSHALFTRPLPWLAREGHTTFKCRRCRSPGTGIYVARPGNGPVYQLDLLGKKGRAGLRNR